MTTGVDLLPLVVLPEDLLFFPVFLFGVKFRDAIRKLPERKENEDFMGEEPLSFSAVAGVSNDNLFLGAGFGSCGADTDETVEPDAERDLEGCKFSLEDLATSEAEELALALGFSLLFPP